MASSTGRLLHRHSIRQKLKTAGDGDGVDDGSASVTSCTLSSDGNNHPVLTGPASLKEALLQIPGVVAFLAWAVTYYVLSVLTHTKTPPRLLSILGTCRMTARST